MSSNNTAKPSWPITASTVFATIFIAAGINAILRPEHALTFFEFEYPSTLSPAKDVVDALMLVYGIRDIFMGVAMYAAAWHGNRKTLGWIVFVGGIVAVADGIACRGKGANGKAEWGHWGYAPMLIVVGGLLVGGK